ncbi:MAG: hypothetical protein ACYTEQ_16965, partial [Planctomycetota bacterium]
RDPDRAEALLEKGGTIEDPLEIDFVVVPFSPTENSQTAQLKKLMQFIPVLRESPNVDQRKLDEYLVELLELRHDLIKPEDEVVDEAAVAQAPPQEVPPELGGPGADILATGGLPEGIEPAAEAPILPAQLGGAGVPTPNPPDPF